MQAEKAQQPHFAEILAVAPLLELKPGLVASLVAVRWHGQHFKVFNHLKKETWFLLLGLFWLGAPLPWD